MNEVGRHSAMDLRQYSQLGLIGMKTLQIILIGGHLYLSRKVGTHHLL